MNDNDTNTDSSSSNNKGQKSDLAFIAKYGSLICAVGIPWWIITQIRDDTETRHWVEETYPGIVDTLREYIPQSVLGSIPYDAGDEYRLVWEQNQFLQQQLQHQQQQHYTGKNQVAVHVRVAAAATTTPQQEVRFADAHTHLSEFALANPDVLSIERIERLVVDNDKQDTTLQASSSSSPSSSSSSLLLFPPHWLRVQVPTGLSSIETKDTLSSWISREKQALEALTPPAARRQEKKQQQQQGFFFLYWTRMV
jgi:hypothetical protein